MRIESNNPFGPAVTPAPVGGDSGVRKAAAAAASGVKEAAASGGFAPTGDLSRLLSLVRAEPEVRTDVVSDVTARAATGELNTRQAATDTAAAFLDSEPAT